MKNGKCPKCQSQDIIVFEGNDKNDGEILGFNKKIFSNRYVCCNCGYTERYFEGTNLEKIKKKYKKLRS